MLRLGGGAEMQKQAGHAPMYGAGESGEISQLQSSPLRNEGVSTPR